tara:strand:- start:275 stop:493 length:219 start_codon:yes stop_codon:yes gene_type:complete
MPKPNKFKATGDKNSGYSNTLKINNTTYVSNKDKLYYCLSKAINCGLHIHEFNKYLKSDFDKLGKYLLNFNE